MRAIALNLYSSHYRTSASAYMTEAVWWTSCISENTQVHDSTSRQIQMLYMHSVYWNFNLARQEVQGSRAMEGRNATNVSKKHNNNKNKLKPTGASCGVQTGRQVQVVRFGVQFNPFGGLRRAHWGRAWFLELQAAAYSLPPRHSVPCEQVKERVKETTKERAKIYKNKTQGRYKKQRVP